jgi:hypothetical protein
MAVGCTTRAVKVLVRFEFSGTISTKKARIDEYRATKLATITLNSPCEHPLAYYGTLVFGDIPSHRCLLLFFASVRLGHIGDTQPQQSSRQSAQEIQADSPLFWDNSWNCICFGPNLRQN